MIISNGEQNEKKIEKIALRVSPVGSLEILKFFFANMVAQISSMTFSKRSRFCLDDLGCHCSVASSCATKKAVGKHLNTGKRSDARTVSLTNLQFKNMSGTCICNAHKNVDHFLPCSHYSPYKSPYKLPKSHAHEFVYIYSINHNVGVSCHFKRDLQKHRSYLHL